MLAAAIAVALAFWGGPPPACPIVAYHVRDLKSGVLGVFDSHPGEGWCEIKIQRRRIWHWDDLCTTLVHEDGHAHGYYDPIGYTRPNGRVDHRHSPDSRSVMYPYYVRVADACRGRRPAGYPPGTTIRFP